VFLERATHSSGRPGPAGNPLSIERSLVIASLPVETEGAAGIGIFLAVSDATRKETHGIFYITSNAPYTALKAVEFVLEPVHVTSDTLHTLFEADKSVRETLQSVQKAACVIFEEINGTFLDSCPADFEVTHGALGAI